MDVGEIIAIAISATVAGGAFLGTRTERSSKVADTAINLINPLTDRLTALEAELDGCRKENRLIRLCLKKHGIDFIADECSETRDAR